MTYGFVVKNFVNNLYVFFLLTTYKSYSGTKTNTEEKHKTKIEKKDNDFDVQRKADFSETVIGKALPKNKNILGIFVMDP